MERIISSWQVWAVTLCLEECRAPEAGLRMGKYMVNNLASAQLVCQSTALLGLPKNIRLPALHIDIPICFLIFMHIYCALPSWAVLVLIV